jgi:hypothetical protein
MRGIMGHETAAGEVGVRGRVVKRTRAAKEAV